LTLLCAPSYNRIVPLYEYECQDCHFRFEKLQRMSDPPPRKCPECGGKIVLQLSRSAVRFKGSGWYATDYARKSPGGESKPAENTAEGKADSKAESKAETKTESKSESKTESKSESKTESKSESKTESKSDRKGSKETKRTN
jgi:putative FmdB family regulatory protein